MTRFIEWRRTQIAIRRKRQLKIAAWVFFGTPASLILISGLWRLAVFMVVS